MSILFGHPTGNPNSHHAAWAHYEACLLEAFCVPWMPTDLQLAMLRRLPVLRAAVARLERRRFPALLGAPRIEGIPGEIGRMGRRLMFPGHTEEGLSYAANDWLMKTMEREIRRPAVTAIHSYEDCSLLQFRKARRSGKACIYDMPIGYYPAWQRTEAELAERYSGWLPPEGFSAGRFARPAQKREEMELADLVLAPSAFVRDTIGQYLEKEIVVAPYGVDLEFWYPRRLAGTENRPLRFIYAGQCSIRKGIPVLINAWRRAGLLDATLELVGSWQFHRERQRDLPSGMRFSGPVSAETLRAKYQESDVFVFPSFFEGFGLVILEAMACGLPVIATDRTAGPDLLDVSTGRVIAAGDEVALVEMLRWFSAHRDRLPEMKAAARRTAENWGWKRYRTTVSDAVASFL